jgi:hypothetical protein
MAIPLVATTVLVLLVSFELMHSDDIPALMRGLHKPTWLLCVRYPGLELLSKLLSLLLWPWAIPLSLDLLWKSPTPQLIRLLVSLRDLVADLV